jgi:putative nucleotidyltransferase with HDIG domain
MKEIIKYIYKNTGFIYKAVIFLSALLLIVYFFPKEGQFKYDFEKNKPWQYENLYAPIDFALKKSDNLISNEKDSIKKITPYFVIAKPFKIKNILSKTTKAINEKSSALTVDDIVFLKNLNNRIVRKIYKIGIIDQKPKDFDNRKVMLIEEKKVKEINPQLIYTIHDIKNLLSPYFTEKRSLEKQLLEVYYENLLTNLSMDSFYYEKTLKQNLENVSVNKGLVLKGAHIVSKGEIINQNIYEKLQSLKQSSSLQNNKNAKTIWIYTGYSILVAIVLLMLFLFLLKYRPEIYENNVKITLIVFNMVLMVFLTTLTVKYDASYVFLVPLAILPLILKAFFDSRIGLFVHVLSILLLGFVVPNSFEFIFLQIMAGIVTILTVSELTKRSNLFSSVGNIILIYILGYFAFHLIHEGNIDLISGKVFVLFLLNGILTIALSHQLILIYEKVFGLASDVSLLELSNTNTKLLKRLADKAPGTFNHSLQVANLAEAAANEINANALLVRAGALYHDVGKLLNPFYFTENQTSGVNHHDDLDPVDSARIIIQHVLDGIELARKNNVPDRLIDFIRTHHGTNLVQYFYKKAKEINPDIDKELFRYPGPNPFSKETAILMMADSIEAASKSLREPTAEKIESFVDKIIDNQLHSGLLANANITFKEITLIKKLFKKKLKNIYHLRIEYPE